MTTELEKKHTGIVAFEDFLTTDRPEGKDEGELGNEGIGREDVTMPRIGLAQMMSPEINPTHERSIDGLKFNELFHTGWRKPLGPGPLHFVILRRYDPRWIEFFPIDQGGGVKEFNVQKGDPRTDFTTGTDGKRVKPIATMFYDYIVLLLNDLDLTNPMNNVVALSFKSSGLKAAKNLNMLIQARGQKLLPKGVYRIAAGKPATDKKSQGTYAVYVVDNAGWLKPDSEVEKMAIGMFESWKDRSAPKIDTDTTAEEIDDSLANNPPPDDMPQM